MQIGNSRRFSLLQSVCTASRDLSPLEELLTELNTAFEERGVRLSAEFGKA